MIQYIKDIFTIIFNPKFWSMNNRYSKNWNRELNKLMETHNFEYLDDYIYRYKGKIPNRPHYVKLGGVTIWVENYPYASFVRSNVGSILFEGSRRPSRLTIIRANRKMLKDLLPKEEKRKLTLEKIGI